MHFSTLQAYKLLQLNPKVTFFNQSAFCSDFFFWRKFHCMWLAVRIHLLLYCLCCLLTTGSDSWPWPWCSAGKGRVSWSLPLQAEDRAIHCRWGHAHGAVSLLWQERYFSDATIFLFCL